MNVFFGKLENTLQTLEEYNLKCLCYLNSNGYRQNTLLNLISLINIFSAVLNLTKKQQTLICSFRQFQWYTLTMTEIKLPMWPH